MVGLIDFRAIEEATDANWQEWSALLDERGAAKLNQGAIVAKARDFETISSWWALSVTDRPLTLLDVAEAEGEGGCSVEANFEGDHRTFPNGVGQARLEHDRYDSETGQRSRHRGSAVLGHRRHLPCHRRPPYRHARAVGKDLAGAARIGANSARLGNERSRPP